jgi:hypothetical protein
MMEKKTGLLVLVLILMGGIVFAAPFDAAAFQVQYRAVMESTKEDLQGAIEFLDGVLADDPLNPEALIYKGSILSKIADRDFWFWEKLAHVNEGIDLMTRGMNQLDGERGAAIPEERKLTMYINRGITCAAIPANFKQRPIARRELERARNHPSFSLVDEETRAQILAFLL